MSIWVFISLLYCIAPSFALVKLSSGNQRFVDTYGRERFFRGVNVVYKSAPWAPITDHFQSNLSFSIEDMQLLQSLGVNAIRLGVMWPGVFPENGVVNSTYLSYVNDIVNMSSNYHIYSLLDAHQDALSGRFCGEGSPLWAFPDHPPPRDFPAPITTTPYPTDDNGIPDQADCNSHEWYEYLWTYDAAAGYQTLYTAPTQSGYFSDFWATATKQFVKQESVIGIEVINEPFPGDVFNNSNYRNNSYADANNLYPFYEKVGGAIWEQDGQRLVAFEPSWPVGDQDINPNDNLSPTSGFSQLPSGPQGTAGNIYAFHYYNPPCTSNLTDYLEGRLADAERLSAIPFATEFDLDASSQSSSNNMAQTLNEFEGRFISFTGWEYKSYAGSLPDGTCTGCGNAFFLNNGSLNTWMTRAMGRPFAFAVQGHALAMSFDISTRIYTFSYSIADPTQVTAPTEILVPAVWYPEGCCNVTTSPRLVPSIQKFPAVGNVAPGVYVDGYYLIGVNNDGSVTGQVTVTLQPLV